MPSITSKLPLFPLNTKSWSHIKSLPLADPQFATPGQIDLLLAGDVYGLIIQSGLCKGQPGEPIAQNTSLGWILSGEVALQNHVNAFPVQNFHVSKVEIGEYIKKFYEIEEVTATRELSKEEKWTVEHYNRTYQRQANGKFMVRLPFKFLFDPTIQLGSSFSMALKRFQWLKRRFHRDSKFHEAYVQTFNEYKQLNQVKLVESINDDLQNPASIKHFYLPHHAVIKESSLTTKLRQVFDGSAKSSNGNSLNDILTTGPSLQSDIVSIILNWRAHKFVFIADIEKMYRCIDVHPDDTDYQRLIWEEGSQLQTYSLQTVTFGIKPSAFLAQQTLHTLADLEIDTYPLAHTAIKKETYVDDVTSGSDTIEHAIVLTNQLIQMLRGAGFELRKWASNSTEILRNIPQEYHEQNTTCLLNAVDNVKALGLCWSTTKDCFYFNVNFSVCQSTRTKRTVLSIIARLFDPLGWLNPFVTKAKLFLNKLWEANLEWDTALPPNFEIEWSDILQQFQFINQLTIPRWICTTSESKRNELHVFCDSSNKAHTTAIHLRTINSSNVIHVSLLIAKSKVNPVRKPLSTPRGELCGAVLAVKALEYVKENFRLKIDQTFLWTDSSVVLSWIRGDPNRWAVFVSNRIHRILTSTDIKDWRHVVSNDNVADLNSRGLTVTQLRDSTLWWNGPAWLSLPANEWPNSPLNIINDDPVELRSKFKSINVTTNEISRLDSILFRFSNFNRLRYSIAYLLRYVQKLRNVIELKKQGSQPHFITSSLSIKDKINNIPHPTVEELERAEIAIIRWVQHEHFGAELNTLTNNEPISRKNKLFRLAPFIDSSGMLRVGGRLTNALIPYSEKFPLILPSKHRIASLIVDFHHKQTLHGGSLVTSNQIRQKFWILDLRNFARHLIQKCVICFKNKPVLSRQLMGSLPSHRVNDQSRPFSATIIDYAGPYDIRTSRGRGQKSYKGYVAVFTCMATKAVHLELAGDLSTQTFLHAFDRFIARRGLCHDVFSDCGTNFVGADNDMKRSQADFEMLMSKEVLPHLNNRGIKWHFSLAEAAVKSMKFHFCRIIGQAKLTFEEFSTVLARIEAVLNSRPISPISNDPNDLNALTPGHFLIGGALLARPQPPTSCNPVKRYQMMETMVQHFWQRFRNDILSTMQVRTKWQDQQPNLNIDDLVLIKDDRFPVNQWPMGRIIGIHPGADKLVRAVSIRTPHGMLKRPITKLCIIPTQHDI
ncbi:uncharacterized protein LOC129575097 [Sitodiplosis mosellana]|uniref:uncharacterized protein LOC129575097 n=1 Tax=Sitodiplosis mosellana TaxID=263140 RepID=UPI0024451113|nr:uncharacterized protein LOC129575097 [Sitodiplosis mosellana]